MNDKTIAIIGAGLTGIMVAHELTRRGYDVHIFEKGFPVPSSSELYQARVNLSDVPRQQLVDDFRTFKVSGKNTPFQLQPEVILEVGGMANRWEGITLRMHPDDFHLASRTRRGIDWPLTYDDLEPYYVRAETYLGVSGNDDNPFAGERSEPFPLSALPLTYYDKLAQEELSSAGIVTHTTPQARVTSAYDGRAGCQNFGMCTACPIHAKYFPAHHLSRAMETGKLTLHSNTSVRRIITRNGRIEALLVQNNDEEQATEFGADLVFLGGGALHSARLLLLSATDDEPDGLGNRSGHVGRNLFFHQLRFGYVELPRTVITNQIGFWTLQSHQFIDHEERGSFGGIKLEFPSHGQHPTSASSSTQLTGFSEDSEAFVENVLRDTPYRTTTQLLTLHAESDMTDNKYMELSNDLDPLGDRKFRVHFDTSEFDLATLEFGRELVSRIAEAQNGGVERQVSEDGWFTGHHHMSTIRMSESMADGVTNSFGKLHETDGVYVMGSSLFSNTMSVNPTLTLLALAMRTVDYVLDQDLSE